MLEAYLFIDPLCTHCIRSEKDFLKISDHLTNKFLYQFIPILSINMQHQHTEYYEEHHLTKAQQCRVNYLAVLDYYAASFQGRKMGRQFLLQLQNELLKHKKEYNDQLVLKIAKQIHLDLEMFEEDRHSELAKESFKRDQKLASEMHIKNTASAVIFDCDSNKDGIKFDHFNYSQLYNTCKDFDNHDVFKNGQNGYRIPNLFNIKL